jgi:hypothetical protein
MAPDSNTRIGFGPAVHERQDLEFRLTDKPLPNWLPSILISQASFQHPTRERRPFLQHDGA